MIFYSFFFFKSPSYRSIGIVKGKKKNVKVESLSISNLVLHGRYMEDSFLYSVPCDYLLANEIRVAHNLMICQLLMRCQLLPYLSLTLHVLFWF